MKKLLIAIVIVAALIIISSTTTLAESESVDSEGVSATIILTAQGSGD